MRALKFETTLHLDSKYPKPEPQAGESLIRVVQAGICSTDLEICKGYMEYTGVLGHEFVGIVEETDGSAELKGKRIAGEINAACQTCETCRAGRPTHCPNRTVMGISGRDGTFAEYLVLPNDNLHLLPDSLTDNQAVFVEPLAAACEILQQVEVKPIDRVLVIGDGKLGVLCAQVLGLTGCSVTLLGHHADRNQWLNKRGIQSITSTDETSPGFDIVVEVTGSPIGFRLASTFVRPRGTIVLKSTYHGDLSLHMAMLVIDEITVIGSRCGPFAPAIRLLEQSKIEVEPLIHARFALKDGLAAFERAASKGTLKVLLSMES